MKHSSELLGEALQRARSHWKQHSTEGFQLPPAPPGAADRPPFCVAISREAGARGSEIGREVGRRRQWQVYDRELLEEISAETGLRTELLESLDERQTSWMSDVFETFGGGTRSSSSSYIRTLVHVISGLAAVGRCVVVGRGAAYLLPRDRTLRVRVVGRREDRVACARSRLGSSESEARDWVVRTDRERLEFVRTHFQRNEADLQLFDLVLNSSTFTNENCASLILAALESKREQLETSRRSEAT